MGNLHMRQLNINKHTQTKHMYECVNCVHRVYQRELPAVRAKTYPCEYCGQTMVRITPLIKNIKLPNNRRLRDHTRYKNNRTI